MKFLLKVRFHCFILSNDSYRKRKSGYTSRFHRIFGLCQHQRGGRLLRGQIFFQELQAGDGIEGYADSNCVSRTIQRLNLQLLFLKYWRIIEKAFLIKSSEKDTRHRSSRPEVLWKVNILKKFVGFTGKYVSESLF